MALGNGAEQQLTEISRRVAALDGGGDGELTRTLRRLSAELDDARAEVHTLARSVPARAHRPSASRRWPSSRNTASYPVNVDVMDRRFPRDA